jgi:RND family efflux transporter MFP subunit
MQPSVRTASALEPLLVKSSMPTGLEATAALLNPTIAVLSLSETQLTMACVAAQDLQTSAAAACSNLTAQLGAKRACIGWLAKKTYANQSTRALEVLGISNQVKPQIGVDDHQRLEQALWEAIDQSAIIWAGDLALAIPNSQQVNAALTQLELRPQHARVSCAIGIDGEVLGALIIEWDRSQTPSNAQTWQTLDLQLTQIAQTLATILQLQSRAKKLRPSLQSWVYRQRYWLGASLVAIAAIFLIPFNDPVSATARLEGAVQHSLSAPVAGVLKTVNVRPGDPVKAGQVLAELQERDLTLERNKLQSEKAQHENQYNASMAKGDRAAMMIAQAKMQEASAQLSLISGQLERIQIKSPIDGVLIQGDLQGMVGSPIEKGQALLTIAPAERYRVIVEVDERDLVRLQKDQTGQLVLSALPWDQFKIKTERIFGQANAIDGRNVIEVQANLTQPVSGLKPGLRGVAHLQAGQSNLASIWGRRVKERYTMFAWRWLPWSQ